jgi:hypothetical protein
MKYLFLLMIFFTLAGSCQSDLNCQLFKYGIFESTDAQIGDIKIYRNDSIQIEVSEPRNMKDVYRIFWTDECTYRLVLISTKTPGQTFLTPQDTLMVNIAAIEGNAYRYEAFLNGKQFTGDLKQTDTEIQKLNTK